MNAAARGGIVRDGPTVALYTFFVTWGWFLYAFSPAVPLIGAELGVSNALAGLHGTAMAAGTVASGFLTPWTARRFGRGRQAAAGGVAIAAGVLLLLWGPTLAVTLPACLIVAVGGGFALSAAQPSLAAHHGVAGPAALTEANATGAGVGLLAPLALGGAVGLGWGWRPAVAVVVVLALGAVALVLRHSAVPALARPAPPAAPRSTPPAAPVGTAVDAPPQGWSIAFRCFLAALMCGVALEFATTFWASDLVLLRTGASPAVASASVSALIAGMTIARFVVGPLSLRKAPEKLLLVAFAIAGVGWAVLWTATSPVVAIAGLVLTGLGYGAHYPLGIALMLRSSQGRPDQAQAISAIGGGAATGLAPFVLGALADQVGPHQAFLLVPVIVLLGGAVVARGLRAVQADRPGRPAAGGLGQSG